MMVEPNSEQRSPIRRLIEWGIIFCFSISILPPLGGFFFLLHFKIRSIVQFVCYIQYKPIVDMLFLVAPSRGAWIEITAGRHEKQCAPVIPPGERMVKRYPNIVNSKDITGGTTDLR